MKFKESETRQKKKYEKDSKIGDKQEIPEPGVDQEISNVNLELMNQLKEKNKDDKRRKRKVHDFQGSCGRSTQKTFTKANESNKEFQVRGI